MNKINEILLSHGMPKHAINDAVLKIESIIEEEREKEDEYQRAWRKTKRTVEIVNNGTDRFPMYSIVINGEDYCSTDSKEKAEHLKTLLNSKKP